MADGGRVAQPLDYAHLTQYVSFQTHRHSHTPDLVIMSANIISSPTVTSLPISPIQIFFQSYVRWKLPILLLLL